MNDRIQILNYENSIQKSNEFSMAKLNVGLSLNQMQLLAYAIFCTQKDGQTEFHKADFEKKFSINRYNTSEAKKDAQKLTTLQYSTEDLEQDSFEFINIFGSIKYKQGTFIFNWNNEILPHIIDLKDKYITTDLTIASQFKSSFSWTLYDYLKAHYGYWHKPVSKVAALKLFGVEKRKSYESASQFKRAVLDVAITEINEYTEFEVWYKDEKKGRAIIGFDIYWSTGTKEAAASTSQIKELSTIIDAIMENMFTYVNVSSDLDRASAIEYISKVRDFMQYVQEPICITKQHADNLIVLAKNHFTQLELILKRDIEEKNNPKPSFYNWLDDRE